MGTNYAPLVADLFLFCYERDYMMSLSDDKQANIIGAFNITSRYLDVILNINNVYFNLIDVYLPPINSVPFKTFFFNNQIGLIQGNQYYFTIYFIQLYHFRCF